MRPEHCPFQHFDPKILLYSASPPTRPGLRSTRAELSLLPFQDGTSEALPVVGPHCLWPDEPSNSSGLTAYGRTEPSNSPGLTAYGRTETSNSPDLTAYGRTVRQTYVHPAGPPCLWPDRTPALGLTKLVNGGRGCSRRKHGYRKQSGTRILLPFPLPLALYARVLSKPGEM